MAAEGSTTITLGGKGTSLSSSSVFKVASCVANVQIDSSAKERLSSKNLKSVKRSSFGIPEGFTNEEMRASLVVILNKLLLSNSGHVLPDKIIEILNSKDLSFESGEIDVTEREILVLDKSSASLIGLCSIIDHKSTTLAQIGDFVAALSCEATKSDITSFSSLDSSDGNVDKDVISVASDLKVLLNGSKAVGKFELEEISKTPWIHGKFREVVRNVHLSALRQLNSGVKGGKTGSGNSGIGESLGATLSALLKPIKSFGDCSLLRGKMCLDSIRNENVKKVLSDLFGKSILEDNLKNGYKLACNAIFDDDCCRFAHELNVCLGIVWRIVAFEAVSAFFALAGGELFGEKTGDAEIEEETTVFGKGTSEFLHFFKDRLVNSNEAASVGEQIFNLLNPKGFGFDHLLLEKVKDICVSAMETQLQKVSQDGLTISQRNKRRRTSTENSDTFPYDLIINVLSRFPAKSVARSLCLSKLCRSILHSTYFTQLFLTRSLARPQLLFSFTEEDQLFFFSAPQVQNLDEDLSLVAANAQSSFPSVAHSSEIRGPVHGLVCVKRLQISNGSSEIVLVICNPSTGQSFALPKLKTSDAQYNRSLFGYDPVDKKFKVLFMTRIRKPDEQWYRSGEFQVYTLGNQDRAWRMIECSETHYYTEYDSDGICINGQLFYIASVIRPPVPHSMILCFDVRSEKFRVISPGVIQPQGELEAERMLLLRKPTLVNYKGQLGVLLTDKPPSSNFAPLTSETEYFELWVLIDEQKPQWSKRVFLVPPSWKNLLASERDCVFVGVTDNDEVVVSPMRVYLPFYLLYCNLNTNTIRRVEIQGMDASYMNTVLGRAYVNTKLGHVENLEQMSFFRSGLASSAARERGSSSTRLGD